MPYLFQADSGADAVTPFVSLVNRFLHPVRCSFAIAPRPAPGGAAGQGVFTGSVALPAGSGAQPGWQGRFAMLLRSLMGETRDVTMVLTMHHGSVRVGEFRDAGVLVRGGTMDVGDILRLPDRQAAGAIVHELEEQRQRQALGVNTFAAAHGVALASEAVVAGERVLEFETPGRGRNPIEGAWEWWIGYRGAGATVRALMIEMNGMNVMRARFADRDHADSAAFVAAARARGLAQVA